MWLFDKETIHTIYEYNTKLRHLLLYVVVTLTVAITL